MWLLEDEETHNKKCRFNLNTLIIGINRKVASQNKEINSQFIVLSEYRCVNERSISRITRIIWFTIDYRLK